MIERKICPLCKTLCYLRPISCFDPSYEKYGGMFVCPRCQWDDWGYMLQPDEIRDFFEREGNAYEIEVAKEEAKEQAEKEQRRKRRGNK